MRQSISKRSHSKVLNFLIVALSIWLGACSYDSSDNAPTDKDRKVMLVDTTIQLSGDWIVEPNAKAMFDPQTSGLSFADGVLYTVSDGSAHESQVQQIHKLNPQNGAIIGRLGPLKLSPTVAASCFASYLQNKPDYEAIVTDSGKPNTWLLVTEDASKAKALSEDCAAKFAKTGSTDYPTLLVQVQLIDNILYVNGVRSLQFEESFSVGNFPNDGIEGMAVTKDNRILFGLEKDANTQARVFEVDYTNDLFEVLDDFIAVRDSLLWLPEFEQGNHPINGMDIYYPDNSNSAFLVLAARNDDQLWFVDINKQAPTKIINVDFSVNCREGEVLDETKQLQQERKILSTHSIANTALEGVAIFKDRMYLINDPWKKVYKDNQTCAKDQSNYDTMSPMLFQTIIDPKWLK